MKSYTVHYITAAGEARTAVARAESAAAARVGMAAHLLASDTITRVALVNDHVAPRPPSPYMDCTFDPADPSELVRCNVHGGWQSGRSRCQTVEVLDDVRAERSRQFARYGTNEDIEDGTGPYVEWLQGVDAWGNGRVLEKELRANYEEYEAQHGAPTWRHLVLEEVAEVFAESDPKRLREELVQVAALAVSWIEKIDAREDGDL